MSRTSRPSASAPGSAARSARRGTEASVDAGSPASASAGTAARPRPSNARRVRPVVQVELSMPPVTFSLPPAGIATREYIRRLAQIGKAGPPVSHISQAYPDRVEVRGRDLTGDLMGRLSFSEYFHLLLTGEEPTEDQRFFLDLLLVAIAEHGMMPTNVAARMTLAADPGSLQGAVAAGILGCGPVILGTSEECARVLEDAQGKVTAGGDATEVAGEIA